MFCVIVRKETLMLIRSIGSDLRRCDRSSNKIRVVIVSPDGQMQGYTSLSQSVGGGGCGRAGAVTVHRPVTLAVHLA